MVASARRVPVSAGTQIGVVQYALRKLVPRPTGHSRCGTPTTPSSAAGRAPGMFSARYCPLMNSITLGRLDTFRIDGGMNFYPCTCVRSILYWPPHKVVR